MRRFFALMLMAFLTAGLLAGCFPMPANDAGAPEITYRSVLSLDPLETYAPPSESPKPETPQPAISESPAIPAGEEEPETPGFTVMIGGDVLIWGGVERALERGGADAVIDPALAELLREADIALVNLEMAVSERGEPADDKQYTFRSGPECLELLTHFGADAVSLANNHTLDYGREALLDTIAFLDDAGIGHAGAGANFDEASAPWVTDINGRKIAVICASRVLPTGSWSAGSNSPGLFSTYDPKRVNEAVSAAKKVCDYVIVYVHWGIERSETPEPYQRELAYGYIDAGADAVIGAHPHVLQGFEFYKEKPIAYSLGNFIFTTSSAETCAVRLRFTDEEIALEIIPCTLKSPYTSLVTDAETIGVRLRALEEISFGVMITRDGRVIPSSD